MLTTTDIVRQIVQKSPFVSEILRQNCLNLSQYAQNIQKQVEIQTFKKVQLGSIITALGRIRKEIDTIFDIQIKINDLSLKVPITAINFAKNADHPTKISQIYQQMSNLENNFLNIISGNTETGIFVNSLYESQILAIFTQKPNLVLSNLAAISIKFAPTYLETSGVVYKILQLLVWQKINLLEIISTFTELTLIVDRKFCHQVFEILDQNYVLKK